MSNGLHPWRKTISFWFTYETIDSINLVTLFFQDLLQGGDNVQLRVVNYIYCGNGKSIQGISHTSIWLVSTCLILNWDPEKNDSPKEICASFIEVKGNDLIWNFMKIQLVKSNISYIKERYDRKKSGLISDNGWDSTNINPFYYNVSFQLLRQHQGTIGALLNRNKNINPW